MKYSRFNIIYRLQKWMDSVAGQTFLNYAYSWGASIVILGTLFKLTHMPSADLWLFLGMGTEVLVFFISAFDRPFDKTLDGMALQNSVTQGMAPQSQGMQDVNTGMADGKAHEEAERMVKAISEAYRRQLETIEEGTRVSEDISRELKQQAYELSRISRTMAGVSKAIAGKSE